MKSIDFIGIGVPKGGTTWVYECMKVHPEICLSIKEHHYFNKKHMFFRTESEDMYEKIGFDGYMELFSDCDSAKTWGEVHTLYLWDEMALKRIKEHVPKAKFFVILRNPSERTFSHYVDLQAKNKGYVKDTLIETMEAEPGFGTISDYHDQLQVFLKYFPKNQLLVTYFDDIAKDPTAFMQKLYAYVGVDDSFTSPLFEKKINKTAGEPTRKKLISLRKKVEKSVVGKTLINTLRALGIYRGLGKVALNQIEKQQTYKKPTDEEKAYLNQRYQKQITGLETLLEVDLSHWKV